MSLGYEMWYTNTTTSNLIIEWQILKQQEELSWNQSRWKSISLETKRLYTFWPSPCMCIYICGKDILCWIYKFRPNQGNADDFHIAICSFSALKKTWELVTIRQPVCKTGVAVKRIPLLIGFFLLPRVSVCEMHVIYCRLTTKDSAPLVMQIKHSGPTSRHESFIITVSNDVLTGWFSNPRKIMPFATWCTSHKTISFAK